LSGPTKGYNTNKNLSDYSTITVRAQNGIIHPNCPTTYQYCTATANWVASQSLQSA